ncbi:MAG: polysaccharide biosynthesis tyrosine autokinase [Chloroflexi bacterium]|nr:polysaccharide biosynthesis tyrosine autokinase [Chloroflexota bacterium]
MSNTQLIELKVRNLDPELAANIANTIPVVFIERSEALQLGRFSESKAALSQELSRVQADIELTQTAIKAIGSPNTAAEETELGRLQTALAQYRSNYATLLSNYEAIRLAEAQAMDSVIVFQEATVPGDPVLSNTKVNVLLAAAVGAALAIGIAFLVEYLDDTLKSPQDVSRVLGLTTLGTVARMRTKKRNGRSEDELVTTATPRSPVSEAFRTLRTNIQFSSVDKPIRRLLVTSAGPSDGKSITAINLAIVMAQSGQSVILIDTDLRRPVLHKALSLSNDKGITNRLLADPAGDLDGCLLPTGVENLRLLASGPLPPNPSELLGSQRMHKLIEQLEQQADVLIFDSPPVLAVTDAAVLAGQMDGVVLVIAAGGTREDMARRVLAELTQVGAPILGVVLNKVPVGRGGGYGYYYYRHYYADESRQSSSMPET